MLSPLPSLSVLLTALLAITPTGAQLRKHSSSSNNIRDINNDYQDNQRGAIINGYAVSNNDYPWFVKGGEGCGGSLVSSLFILTTATCVDFFTGARIGTLCTAEDNCGQAYERIGVKEVFVHPDYDEETYSHDIALIQLKKESVIEPVALDLVGISNEYTSETELWVAGLGRTTRNVRSPSDRLRHAQLNYVDETACSESYPSEVIDESMMCAIGEDQGSCFGDAGGPLYDEKNEVLVGTLSWGGAECAKENEPSVYSRISHVASFLKGIICDATYEEVPQICMSTASPTSSPSSDLDGDTATVSMRHDKI